MAEKFAHTVTFVCLFVFNTDIILTIRMKAGFVSIHHPCSGLWGGFPHYRFPIGTKAVASDDLAFTNQSVRTCQWEGLLLTCLKTIVTRIEPDEFDAHACTKEVQTMRNHYSLSKHWAQTVCAAPHSFTTPSPGGHSMQHSPPVVNWPESHSTFSARSVLDASANVAWQNRDRRITPNRQTNGKDYCQVDNLFCKGSP